MYRQFKTESILLTIALAILMLLSLGCGGEKADKVVSSAKIDFIEGYSETLAAAKETGKPALVDFYTDWCRWCKVLDTVTYVDPDVIALSDKIVFGRLNAEVDTVAAKANGVSGYPTLVLFDSEGKEIDRIVGYLPPEQFIETVNNYLNGINTLDYYKAMADSAPSPEVDYNLAGKYNDRSQYEDAEKYYRQVIMNNPDNDGEYTSNSMMALADMSLSMDNYDEAVTRYKELKSKFSDSAMVNDADIMIAICYRSKGDTTAAITAFNDFLKAHPNSPDTGYALKQIDRLQNPPEPEESK